MDSAATASTTTSSSVDGGHRLIGSRLEDHRKYMSESSLCPRCGHKIDRKLDWVGLPAGVKFDPTDQELIEHLEAKVGLEAAAVAGHPLIDEFIRPIEVEDGICYTHPEKLPGVTKDGLSRHFFHRPSKAYTTGTRKRRKIQPPASAAGTADAAAATQRSETRWHKTGKTRPVVVSGRQRGCKKILVLYTNFGKHRKPEKTNWVMHQYHLGEAEEEREGELVVSKIFYQTQPRQCGAGDTAASTATAVERRRNQAAAAAAASNVAAFHGGVDEFGFAQYQSSFEEVGMGASEVHATRADVERHHHQGEHDHQRHYGSHEQCEAAAFHVSTPTDPVATLIAPARISHSSVVLREAYDTTNYHLEGERPHQPQKFDGRSTSGLEEVIMGCTSRRSKGETSGGKDSTEWQYPSFWPSDTQDHHG